MKRTRKLALLAIFPLSLILSSAARADDLSFTLDSPVQEASPGTTISFSGTITAPATNADTVFLLGDSFNLAAPLTLDDSPYLINFPLTLDPGQDASGVLFNITVPLDAPVADDAGSFTIQASTDGVTEDIQVTDPFAVQVTPEPSSLFLLGTGLIGLVTAARRSRAMRAA